MGISFCRKCGKRLGSRNWYKSSKKHNDRICKVCIKQISTERQKLHNAERMFKNCLRNAGTTEEQYFIKLSEQEGVCAICLQPETGYRLSRLAIDHCHLTGKFRGLLCGACNRALGLFKDSTMNLARAITYLSKD